MARQPAINVDILFIVTFQTLPHPPRLVRQPLQIFNLSVTFPAGDLAVDMSLMVEQHMFRHIIDFYPWCRCLGVEIAVFGLYPWMLGDDIVMAVQALFHRRQARKIGICHVRMAILALNLFDATVDIMTERYRLLRSKSGRRRSPEIIYKGRHKEYGD